MSDIHFAFVTHKNADARRQDKLPLFGVDDQLVLLTGIAVNRPAAIMTAAKFRIAKIKCYGILNF